MSATRSYKRPKGWMPDWSPQPHTVALLDNVLEILDRNRAYLPLTARQVFYMLVGQYDYDKTEQAYARLCEALVKARRARIVPFGSIRDDGTVSYTAGSGFDSTVEWWQSELSMAEGYARPKGENQPYAVEVWCEAAGMAPQLARAVREFGVSVYSTGGFSSVTVTYEVSRRVISLDKPTVFMHIGDYDPSGESIFESMSEDIGAFVDAEGFGFSKGVDERGSWFQPIRVALTREQVREYDLPTAPPKRTDSRSSRWRGETCQAEAMEPATLTGILRDRVLEYVDKDILADTLQRERQEREELVADVKKMLRDRGIDPEEG